MTRPRVWVLLAAFFAGGFAAACDHQPSVYTPPIGTIYELRGVQA